MKVLKFGGTSVGSVESILLVKQIVEAQTEPVIVVVSALGGVTDKLIGMARMAATGDVNYETEFEAEGIRIVYFPYTKGVSSTKINKALEHVRNNENEYK